jgi:signal transduction histidine kinase/ligand-binding sensor domain-containing protein/FixJ family two-component response regulator
METSRSPRTPCLVQRRPRTWLRVLVAAAVSAAGLLGGRAYGEPAGPADSTDIADVGRPAIKAYTDKEGLPQNSVQAVTIDRSGHLWVGTQGGAARYDGHTWRRFDMPDPRLSNYVRAMLESADGGLWFGMDGGGLARLDRERHAWTVFTTATGFPSNEILCLLETTDADGVSHLWVGTGTGGVARLSGGSWTYYDGAAGLPSTAVYSLAELVESDGRRSVWAGTGGGGVARFRDGGWHAVARIPDATSDVVWGLHQTAIGGARPAILAGTSRGKLMRFEDDAWVDFGKASGFPASEIRCLMETRDARKRPLLWVAVDGGRLASYDGRRWTILDASRGLPGHSIISLTETHVGGERLIWAGTNGGGLLRLAPAQWTTVDRSSGLPNNVVRAILTTEGERGAEVTWIGTDNGGLARFERGAWTIYDVSTGLPSNTVLSLLETAGANGSRALWVGLNRAGLAKLERGRWTLYDTGSGLPNNSPKCLLATETEDGRPAILVGTQGGLARFDGRVWTPVDIRRVARSDDIRALIETAEPSGSRALWVGTHGGGVARLLDGAWTVYDVSSGLPSDAVRALLEVREPDGRRTLWVGSYGGVSWIDLDRDGARWQTLSTATAPALPDDVVYQVQRDSAGRIYLFTRHGVARLTRRAADWSDPSTISVYTFTTENGLPGDECNGGASMVDGRGRVWAGTVGGVGIFDPVGASTDDERNELVVSATLQKEPGRTLASGAEIAHDANSIECGFALLSFFRERDVRYRTQLVGFDADPSDWGAETRQTYTNLPSGSYAFLVWGRDHAGNVSGPVALSFEVLPAPWLTWWAFCAYGLLAAGLGYAGVRFRVRALERRTVELEAAVADRTAALAQKADELAVAVERSYVSERRALESEHQAIEASQAKSLFLAHMSHELRTPLNAVIGFAQLMNRSDSLGEAERHDLAIIRRSGEHLLGLINDVLSLAKIEAGKLELHETPYDPRKLLRTVLSMVEMRAASRGLTLALSVDDGFPRAVVGDEGKLRQVLINLLGNAIKFTDSGGITLRAQWSEATSRGLFEVEDTGRGIAPEEIGKLFAAFSQTETGRMTEDGTGLGLFIARRIVRLMGGDLAVMSQPGRGTTFRFDVRLAPAPEEPDAGERLRVVTLDATERRRRVLVVDDDDDSRRLLARLLGTVGFDVREARTGEEAVGLWSEWQPRIVWVDLRMPGMGGTETVGSIRAIERGRGDAVTATTIVAVSASTFDEERKEILASGCDDFVAKPYQESTVFDVMRRLLGLRFVYEAAPASENGEAPSPAFTPARLAALDPALASRLESALAVGDLDTAGGAIATIRLADEELASELSRRIAGFDIEAILSALESAKR